MGHTPGNLTLFACQPPTAPQAARRPCRRLGGRKSRKTENCTYFRENTCNLHVFLRKSNVYANNTKPCDLAAHAPSPRPSLRGKGARGHESAAAGNRCGGTGVSPIVPRPSTGQTPTASRIGRARHTRGGRLPPVSTAHAQETARVVDGRPEDAAADAREGTRQQAGDGDAGDGGREARGSGCRGRGPPCGPPGKPQGAQGPRAATRASPPLAPAPSALDKLPSVW